MTLFYYCLTKVKLDLDVINLTKVDNTVDTKINLCKENVFIELKIHAQIKFFDRVLNNYN